MSPTPSENLNLTPDEESKIAFTLSQLQREVDATRTRPSLQDTVTLLDTKIQNTQDTTIRTNLENLRAYFVSLQQQRADLVNRTQESAQKLSENVVLKGDRSISISTHDRTSLYTDPSGKPTSQTGTTVQVDTRIAPPKDPGDAQKGKEIAESLLQKNAPQVEEGTRLIAISQEGRYSIAQFVSALSIVDAQGNFVRVDDTTAKVAYLPESLIMINGREAVRLINGTGFVFVDQQASFSQGTRDLMTRDTTTTMVATRNPDNVSQTPTSPDNLKKLDESWSAFAALVSPEQKNSPRYQTLLSSYESYKRLATQAGVDPQALEQQKAELMSLISDISKRIDTRTAEYAAMSREINQINALLLGSTITIAEGAQKVAESLTALVTTEELKTRLAGISESVDAQDRMMGLRYIFDWMRSQGYILLPQGESFQVLKKTSQDAAPVEQTDLLNTLTVRGVTLADIKSYLIVSSASFDDLMQPYIENGKILKTPSVETFVNDLAKKYSLSLPLTMDAIKANPNIAGSDRDLLIAAAQGAFTQDMKREITQEAQLYIAQKDAFEKAEQLLERYPSIMAVVGGALPADLSVTPGAGPATGGGASATQAGATPPSPSDPTKPITFAGWWNRPGETVSQFISRSPGAAAVTFLVMVFAASKMWGMKGFFGSLVGLPLAAAAGPDYLRGLGKLFGYDATMDEPGTRSSTPAASNDTKNTPDDILKLIDTRLNQMTDTQKAQELIKRASDTGAKATPPKTISPYETHVDYLKSDVFLSKPAKDLIDLGDQDRGNSLWGAGPILTASTTLDLVAPIHKNMVRLLILGEPKEVSGIPGAVDPAKETAWKEKYWDVLTAEERNTYTIKQLIEHIAKIDRSK